MPRIPAQKSLSRHLAVAALATCVGGAGCDLIDALNSSGGLVHVYATHHATPQDGSFPETGGGDERIFHTDNGWMIVLEDAYVVTSTATLYACDGSGVEVDLYYGQLPENLTWTDLEVRSLGAVEVPAGEYCSLVVEYEPYIAADFDGDTHSRPDVADLDGATMFLRGYAEKDGHSVEFTLRNQETISVELDLSAIDGGAPFTMREREAFPRELTVSKTYDRFFDEIELEIMEEPVDEDASQVILDVLADETRISLGTIVGS